MKKTIKYLVLEIFLVFMGFLIILGLIGLKKFDEWDPVSRLEIVAESETAVSDW